MLVPVKRLRLEIGLRQFDVARQVGISESKLSKIETGRVRPSEHELARLAEVLGVDPEALELAESASK